jgi:predicted regulator of Ras-like GTPase activity (Roadblock/LC7/MglB family)
LQRQREAFKEAKWEQRIAQLEEQGTKAISSLMRKSVDGLPRAAEVSTRIDQIVAALPANLQLNPEAYQQSYVMALGEKYLEELKTGKAAVGSKKAVVNTPGKGGAVNAAPKVTFEVPPAALAELARRGMTLDDQARELGYESWAAYQADDEEGK